LSLLEQARQFRVVLNQARERAAAENLDWYPYDSLSNIEHLETLLGSNHRYVLESGQQKGVLDIGCGDGDLAFFLESQGYNVTCVDYPPSNQNAMQGLRALHRELRSAATIREIDVDNEFPLDGKYGLVFCLGVLYHLKNPFYVLERLARISPFCVLSTRIARRLPGGAPMPQRHALAYLLGEDELNVDDTNYWIFSESGLRRLLQRSRWEVVEFFTTGDTILSDPASLDHDERAFCLLKSHYGYQHLELLEGWHQAEESGWRRTERRFATKMASRSGDRYSKLEMRVFAPPLLIEKFGTLTLRVKINDSEVRPLVMREAGIHVLARKIPRPSNVTSAVFQLDHALGPNAGYSRELGIVVASIEFM
jgi:tRNA (mo5U34)-methyltransferase